MKTRTFTIITVVLVILIAVVTVSGISKNKTQPRSMDIGTSINRGFGAKATIKMKNLEMVGDINRSADKTMTVVITQPNHLKGMTFKYDGKDISIEYLGMKLKLDENTKLVGGATQALISAINKATEKSGVDVKIDGKSLLVSGETESGKFKMKLDKKTGSIISVAFDKLDFECNFDEFLFK